MIARPAKARTKAVKTPLDESKRLIEAFRIDCELRGLRTISTYMSILNRYASFVSGLDKDISKVNRDDLISFLAYLKNSETRYAGSTHGFKSETFDKIFAVISSFYTWAVDEEIVIVNPVVSVRRRYLKKYKEDSDRAIRQIISVEDASTLINSVLDTRDKAILALLFKTGMRLGELVSLDLADVDLNQGEITLKVKAKRSNRVLFIDQETIGTLRQWILIRPTYSRKQTEALFTSRKGDGRLGNRAVQDLVLRYAERCGLHDPSSGRSEDHFSPHCCRHWFTTHLIRNGMPRDFVKELRGDSRREAIDLYNHIDKKELKEAYLAAIPPLGI